MLSQSEWTIMVYMAGDNSLSDAGDADLDDMRTVGSSDKVQLVVEFDNAGDVGTRRIHIKKDGVDEAEHSLGETDSGSPDVLLNFITWAAKNFPAKRYALILWSHGSGWVPVEAGQQASSERAERSSNNRRTSFFRKAAEQNLEQSDLIERAIGTDDVTGHSIDTIELGNVVAKAHKIIGQPIDLLGMDACLMSNIEIAYQLRGHIRYLVASEETGPEEGWPYEQILGRLLADPTMASADLAGHIVKAYVAWYDEFGLGGEIVTQTAMDMDKLSLFTDPLEKLASQLISKMPKAHAEIWKAQRKSTNFWEQTLWDLGHFCEQLHKHSEDDSLRAEAQAVQAALEPGKGRFVIAESHMGRTVENCKGVTIYLLPVGKELSKHYFDLDFAKKHAWAKMLEAYHDV
jgi:hypothetical protein